MSRHSAARGAAWGGGGLAGSVAAMAGVLLAQGRLARHRIGPQRIVPPYQDGRFGPRIGRSVRLAIIGDSVAAGLGADVAADTLAGVLVAGVLAETTRPVTMTNHAVVGARSMHLEGQVSRCLSAPPHVVVIVIGANDVTHLVRHSVAAEQLGTAVMRLTSVGVRVVVGTCPDLGTIRPVGPPLRWVARSMSRLLAAEQRAAAEGAGARTVSLIDLLGPEFTANADTLFANDRFHPSGLGYRRIGASLLPAVLAELPSSVQRRIRGDLVLFTVPGAAQ